MILPGGRFLVFVATRPVDFRNYAGRMIMQSRRARRPVILVWSTPYATGAVVLSYII